MLIFGLKTFRSYLLGRHFQIRVDNQALTFYQRTKEPTGQRARYLDFLADFDFEISYRSGSMCICRHLRPTSMPRVSEM